MPGARDILINSTIKVATILELTTARGQDGQICHIDYFELKLHLVPLPIYPQMLFKVKHPLTLLFPSESRK